MTFPSPRRQSCAHYAYYFYQTSHYSIISYNRVHCSRSTYRGYTVNRVNPRKHLLTNQRVKLQCSAGSEDSVRCLVSAGDVTQLYGYYQSRVASVSVTHGWNFITLIRFITSRPRADNRPHAASQGEMKKLVRYRHLQTDTRQCQF